MTSTTSRSLVNVIVAVWILLVLVTVAVAQTTQGALVGTVSDVNGARVPGATVSAAAAGSSLRRQTTTNSAGEFRLEALPPGDYRVTVSAPNFSAVTYALRLNVNSYPTLPFILKPGPVTATVQVPEGENTLYSQPLETTSSVEKTVISKKDLADIPLVHRSFANIAYLAPMTQPVEPSDPTKARITAVAFGGSSGLNVDLSVDGGDNNDDYIGGFLQNYSPDAMQEFVVRTSQFDADTARTNGGSVIISTRRGTDQWHGDFGYYLRARAFNARNKLDNPEPNPKQPFSRQNGIAAFGGPLKTGKLWFFSSLEYVHENASVAYSALSLNEFCALARLASLGLIPGVTSIDVPTSVPVPFRDVLLSTRVDWFRSARSQWFFRGSLDRNHTRNDLIQQATLPSTGAFTRSNYYSFLIDNQFLFNSKWSGTLTVQANNFHHTKERNSHIGLALAFPFSTTVITTSGFETFGDNQFVTGITAFPIQRDQRKYQFRYDVARVGGNHAVKFGVNFIHEPVLSGRLADEGETLVAFPEDPSFYVANPADFTADFAAESEVIPASNGRFSQKVKRLGFYVQDSWRIRPSFTMNLGLRYDTTFGLFRASGRNQDQNPAVVTLNALHIPLSPGIPHDYRRAFAPRLGFAYSPGRSTRTVIRGGVGLYYNDLNQNGWVDAFRAVNEPFSGLLAPAERGAVIDPNYRTPYALQASLGVERVLSSTWRLNIHYEHQQGVHQYRRYEYVSDFTLPATAPSISLFRTDNRSRYDGVAFQVQHSFSKRFELSAHYTLSSAATWGATVGELADYVNGVSDVRHAFGPGDYGPSGEDVRHRFVLAGTLRLPGKVELITLSQFESARPYTLATPVDLNDDGLDTNDRAVVNGVQTSLDQFRGTPYSQIDLRVSRDFRWGERATIKPFVEFFNLLNRTNPGNNFIPDLSALPVPAGELDNALHICVDSACTVTRPIRSLRDLRAPAGALGDFFGPGTTVGIPFSAQLGVRVSF
ncbi:MAG TPA: hypothetical protein DHU55_01230 [Blastocatellia bacterium]|jgi:hypothetical protein|nr:hypothetical protein [Blastocatellia bacterium]